METILRVSGERLVGCKQFFRWSLALIFHPILILLPVIIPPLDFEEGAKLPLDGVCVEF